MDPHVARTLAIELMKKHGLTGWHFRFDHARRRFGSCQPTEKLITLSRPLTLLNTIDQVRDTILHEIAHALVPGDHHGSKWKAMCRKIGAKPERCFTPKQVAMPPRPPTTYEIGCPACDIWSPRRVLTPSRHICRKCRGKAAYRDRQQKKPFVVIQKGHERIVQYLATSAAPATKPSAASVDVSRLIADR